MAENAEKENIFLFIPNIIGKFFVNQTNNDIYKKTESILRHQIDVTDRIFGIVIHFPPNFRLFAEN